MAYDKFEKLDKDFLSIYHDNIEKLEKILSIVKSWECKMGELFNTTLNFILYIVELENRLNDDFFLNNSKAELETINSILYHEILPEHYKTSFCNPEYSSRLFGTELGQVICALSEMKRAIIIPAFKHQKSIINNIMHTWINLFYTINEKEPKYFHAKEILLNSVEDNIRIELIRDFIMPKDPSDSYFLSIAEKSRLDDLRYLYRYGLYISENEIKTARFFNKLSDSDIDYLAKLIIESFFRGFKNSGKDRKIKKTITLNSIIGQERLTRSFMKIIKDHNMDLIIGRMKSTEPNEQFVHDNKNNFVHYCNSNYFEKKERKFSELVELSEVKEIFKQNSGSIHIIPFGTKPLMLKDKKEAIKADPEHNKMMHDHISNILGILSKYWVLSEISYTMTAFPSPDIGENYEEIFAETIKMNSLDYNLYKNIHQSLINALDKGEYVHIKGRNHNKTDIKIKLQPLLDPEIETNFCSYLADINLPMGEVATSPQLKGTNGIIHIKDAFIKGSYFKNLNIEIKDGYTAEYSCENFATKEESKRFIQENLMDNHHKLPLGEFAIGTNTLAYAMAKKFDILDKLPVLIIEKTGPHFGIGDTCYTYEEDHLVFNPDGKRIVARDNEKTILRKQDIKKAYTNCHKDIALPYGDLDYITVIGENIKIDIFNKGSFVLKGTEELNGPLKQLL